MLLLKNCRRRPSFRLSGVRVSFLGKLPFTRTASRHEPLVFRLSFLPFYVKHRMYCRTGVLRDGDNEYTPGTKKCQLLTVKKLIFFLLFFDFFYLFLHPFFNKKQRGGKCTEKEKPGGGWNGRKRGARKLRLRRYGTVRPERGAGRRRTEDVPGIKKSSSGRRKGFSE